MQVLAVQDGYIIIVVVGGVLVITASILLIALRSEKKRKEAVSKYAEDLGIKFYEQLPSADTQAFSQFGIASKGSGQQAKNAVIADSGELRMTIFDYEFTTGSGKNRTTHRQSMVLAHSPSLQTPAFTISPESFLHRIADWFGFKDIDFDEDPEFSDAFLLKGEDVDAIREFFDSKRRKAFVALPKVAVESKPGCFVFYRPHKRVKPDEYKTLMEEAFTIYQVLSVSEDSMT
jgi:hypothetical protein